MLLFVAGALFGGVQVSLFVAGAVFGEVQVSLFVAGAVFGEVQVSLFVAGAVFCEVQVSLFVAGTVFGEVQVSLFVAGAVFGENWNDSRSAKCCIFQYKMLVVGVKGNLGCEAGCGLTVSYSRIILGSWSDHGRIGRALEMTFHPFSANFFEILDGHFSWQAQYLVSLDYDACCSAHCKYRFICVKDQS